MNYDARWAEKGAKEIKNRNNPQLLGHKIATVVQINPIKVSVLDGQAFFSEDNERQKLIIGNALKEYKLPVTVSITTDRGTYTGTGTAIHEGIKVGDKLICEFTQSNQELIVIDKVGGDNGSN